jgi:L-amino acid N-acyltransferase YncA
MDYIIDEMKESDWRQAAAIYFEGISTGKATFQTEVPSWEQWDSAHLKSCRLAARLENKMIGWAALSPTSSRAVYAGVAEVSIYIKQGYRGMGVGEILLQRLIELSEEKGIWTLQSGILRENTSSILLHKRCGFRELGYREKVGRMPDGTWHDVILMERRSRVIGIG